MEGLHGSASFSPSSSSASVHMHSMICACKTLMLQVCSAGSGLSADMQIRGGFCFYHVWGQIRIFNYLSLLSCCVRFPPISWEVFNMFHSSCRNRSIYCGWKKSCTSWYMLCPTEIQWNSSKAFGGRIGAINTQLNFPEVQRHHWEEFNVFSLYYDNQIVFLIDLPYHLLRTDSCYASVIQHHWGEVGLSFLYYVVSNMFFDEPT